MFSSTISFSSVEITLIGWMTGVVLSKDFPLTWLYAVDMQLYSSLVNSGEICEVNEDTEHENTLSLHR